MDKNLEARLKAYVNFPSPAGVAQQIILLANDPDVKITDLIETLGKDPGLTAKIMRIANSALYARRRRSDNLRQALLVIGLRAATTLALSFSIAPMYTKKSGGGLNYPRCWRRAMFGAVAARKLGEVAGLSRGEDLFLAGLMQDIAMLALDRTSSDFYAKLPATASHDEACRHEIDRIGVDHAAVGEMMLRHWHMPEFIVAAVAASHRAARDPAGTEAGAFNCCVALAGQLAEFCVSEHRATQVGGLETAAVDLLDLDKIRLGEVLTAVLQLVPEIEQLFDARLLDADEMQSVMDQARELLAIRSIESLEQVSTLQTTTHELQQRTALLEDSSRRDALTGIYNRGYLDAVLTAEFSAAIRGNWPLSVIFLDLDHFKRINDTYGHPAGDQVLRSTAQTLVGLIRESDHLGRYGGEEFVVLLPAMGLAGGLAVCERVVKALRRRSHELATESVIVSASLGLAVHCEATPFATVEQLLEAADTAAYRAKRAGRDQFIVHQPPADYRRAATLTP